MALTIASPRPAPPSLRARPESGRAKRSKACGRNCAGKPGPESETSIARSGPAARAEITIGVSAGANSRALSTRLSIASPMRSGSTSAVRLAGACTWQETPAQPGPVEGRVGQVVDRFADAVRVHVRCQVGGRLHLAGDTGRAGAAGCVLRAAGEQRTDLGRFPARGDSVFIASGEEEQLFADAR